MLPPIAFLNFGSGTYEHVGPEIILLEGQQYVFLPIHDASRLSVGELWRDSNLQCLPITRWSVNAARILTKRQAAVQVPYAKREDYVAQEPPKVTPQHTPNLIPTATGGRAETGRRGRAPHRERQGTAKLGASWGQPPMWKRPTPSRRRRQGRP